MLLLMSSGIVAGFAQAPAKTPDGGTQVQEKRNLWAPVIYPSKKKVEAQKAAAEQAKKEQEAALKQAKANALAQGKDTSKVGQPVQEVYREAGDTLPVDVKNYEINSYDDLDKTHTFDLQDPDNIKTEVVYDAETGNYVMHTKLGDTDLTTPFSMTPAEYSNYAMKNSMQNYWREKNGVGEQNNEKKFDITDMKFNIGPADKVFGPGGVQLKLQGSAEMKLGFSHTYTDNPSLSEKARKSNVLDFDEKIQATVDAKVGDKLGFKLSYNTESSFDFDQQNLKLSYKGKEDDIIQTIEAGNVSMPLNSTLIQGSQSLFGVRGDFKFGKLSVQALLSQQRSESQQVNSQGGAQMTDFEITSDQYDENRHFFLSHYFRDNYDHWMQQVPNVMSGIVIKRAEVWVTNKRGNYDNARNLVALSDLGEATSAHILGPWAPTPDAGLGPRPRNKANDEYVTVKDEVRSFANASNYLTGLGMEGGEDFEKIESARLLSSSEYTLNAALGFVSLKTSLNSDEALAVAYEYTYGGQTFQVGEFSTDGISAADSSSTTTTGGYGNRQTTTSKSPLVVKLLKSTNNAPIPGHQHAGTWDLMMKNVYSLGAMQMQQEKFELYLMYKNDSIGTKVQYLPESKIKGKQLIKVLGADRLDSKNNTNPDGKYDWVEGYTVLAGTGRVILPCVEPFGSALKTAIGDDNLAKKYIFQELYDSTQVLAEEMTEKNKFYLKGRYKGSAGNQISLGAMNVPRGSVIVKAGGATLTENVDYTVDYTMGTVTIINSSILESGTNVNVSLENQSTFSMQRKSLFGLHAQYDFNPDLSLGATVMHLTQRPLTTKVNTGSEPISNTIWGINGNWKTNMQWLTNLIDKVPWITATQPSTFTISGEFAQLIPGHTKEVSSAGYAYIDDFESTQTDIDIHYPSYWHLSSVPYTGADDKFGALLTDSIDYGFRRGLMAWYNVDQVLVVPQHNTPSHLAANLDQISDDRVRIVLEQEIFPYRDHLATDDSRQVVMNLAYYPKERGPYNLNTRDMDPTTGLLQNPKANFGGLMRKIDNPDFERANIEYIEFWMMDPTRTNPDPNFKGGKLVFNLGDISEDILKDGKKSFENGIPVDGSANQMEETVWGRVSKTTSTTVAFSNESGARAKQDVGLDGLSTEDEFLFNTYRDYVDRVKAKVSPTLLAQWDKDNFSPIKDPAGDNYHFYRGDDYDDKELSILERYKHYNGTEGNSPTTSGSSYGTAATMSPDIEDINEDNTLNEYEKYYEYVIDIDPAKMVVGQNNITNSITSEVKLRNGHTEQCTWYQFKVPIRGYNRTVGNIRNFKSIRFVRMYMTDFADSVCLRLGTLNLVRGEWRNYTKSLMPVGETAASDGKLVVQSVNYEENSTKSPVNYVLPPGISRQTDPGQAQLIQENEQALVLRVNDLAPDDARGVYKNLTYDLRNYKYLQMFVHAEQLTDETTEALRNGELTCFIRLGSDLQDNYYEYEVPLSLTAAGRYSNDKDEDRLKVWPEANMVDFSLKAMVEAKQKRNIAKHQDGSGVSNMTPYVIFDDDNGKPNNRVTVMGNPTLGEVTTMMLGVRNRGVKPKSGEVWVNELRLKSYNEEGGWAATGQASLAISDIAQLNVTGSMETAGYGSIESNVLTRNMEDHMNLSFSAAVEVGRLLPEKAHIQLPFYYTYTKGTTSPKYNPLDTDVELKDALNDLETKSEKDSLKAMTQSATITKSYTVTNAKIDIKSKTPMFYDPTNVTFSYNYSRQYAHDAETLKDEETTQSGSINYSFSFNPKPWEPFKNLKAASKPSMKWLKDFNIYYLPQSWSFNTNANRTFSQLRLRDLSGDGSGASKMEPSFSHDFMWNRDFNVRYDLSKSLKFTLQGATNATIEEAQYVPEIIDEYDLSRDYYERWKDTIKHSLRHWGTPYSYQQVFTAQLTVPFSKFRALDWITGTASYNATYNWNYLANNLTSSEDLGNSITSLRTWQADGQLNFEQLYNKSKYLKGINQKFGSRAPVRRPGKFTPKTFTQTVDLQKNKVLPVTHKLNSTSVKVVATDSLGNPVSVKTKVSDKSSIVVSSKQNLHGVLLTITTEDPNKQSAGKQTTDFLIRMLMMVRKASVTYRESNSLAIDGFKSVPGFMGQQKSSGSYLSPGLDFAFGMFDKDKFMQKASERGWLASSDSIAKYATSAYTSDFNVKLNLEPIPGLKIDLTAQRYLARSSQIDYMYSGMPETFTGSFNMTQVAIGTAFSKLGSVGTNYHSDVYDKFLEYRDQMVDRIEGRYAGTRYGSTGFLAGSIYANQPYDKSKGGVNKSSADVLIPAFLAAYTGRSLDKVGSNPFLSLAKMLPNWRVTYDGLTRIPWVKKHFQSITLTHAYTCKYSVGNYSGYSTWVGANDGGDRTLGFVRDVQSDMPVPSSAYDISSVSLTEQFMPLIGLNLTMKNSLSTKFEYKKSRNLALNINSAQLIESLSDEFVLGVGYTLKDFDMILKLKSDQQKKVKNDLKLQADFSYKDIKSLLRKIEENVTQASSGNKVFGIKITADYTINSRITVQAYFERQATTPLISTSYPVRNTDFGVNFRFMLTR